MPCIEGRHRGNAPELDRAGVSFQPECAGGGASRSHGLYAAGPIFRPIAAESNRYRGDDSGGFPHA